MTQKKHHNKLVRDLIPSIIEKDGRTCQTRILSDEDYMRELLRKLREEVEEFTDLPAIEELADILEVVRALAETLGTDVSKLEAVREKKALDRGAFKERIYLEWVE
jgi:predicted house-cleaning noncanonical NTP pyrophosphatase (MazG superfamily)